MMPHRLFVMSRYREIKAPTMEIGCIGDFGYSTIRPNHHGFYDYSKDSTVAVKSVDCALWQMTNWKYITWTEITPTHYGLTRCSSISTAMTRPMRMVSLTITLALRSRMTENDHVRFCNGGGVGDCPADRNCTRFYAVNQLFPAIFTALINYQIAFHNVGLENVRRS